MVFILKFAAPVNGRRKYLRRPQRQSSLWRGSVPSIAMSVVEVDGPQIELKFHQGLFMATETDCLTGWLVGWPVVLRRAEDELLIELLLDWLVVAFARVLA